MVDFDAKKLASFGLDQDFPLHLAARVKLLVMDVDGVLTDGGLYYDEQKLAMKRFDVQDGLGIVMARKVGLDVAVITGMQSEITRVRCRDLGIDDVHIGILDKLSCLKMIMEQRNLEWSEVAYVGDDWLDLPMFSRVGLPLSVANAQPELKALARYVSPLEGGHGAVRQIMRHILAARGELGALLEDWLKKYA